ncbi:MAG TPA: NAD(P)H-dependent glycerol-3-phosphate dehydrogenase [Polyangiales bacterium]|nr:NAD(P)H-dependent glycerol-3-phosphate dehydrogenase [Polyangiales bacterium]
MSIVTVLGAGSWGTAIAKTLAERAHDVRLWARSAELVRSIRSDGENAAYLAGVSLPANVRATHDLAEALDGAVSVYVVVPSHGLRDVLMQALPYLPPRAALISASKGIENESLLLMTQVIEQIVPPGMRGQVCALGGPSFAKEAGLGMPTAVCIASKDAALAGRVQLELMNDRFRVYTTDDLIGVELGGALKNVIAIAVGAADGLGCGHNARAALITRALAEMARLAIHMGAHPMTLAGLSGLGDLVLTCTGDLSRNRRVGMELARGRTLAEVLGEMRMVAEGVKTAKSAHALAKREGVDMPITAEVHAALYEGKAPREAVSSLLSRVPRPERD